MKRSEINQYIREAKAFMTKYHFMLPPWVDWTPDDWKSKGPECNDIRERAMGWDLTDFGWGDFLKIGLTLVTLRNGSLQKKDKPYCEKIMFVRCGQVTPTHFHWLKTEDIINRGGGNVLIRVYNSHPDESIDYESDVTVHTDGRTYTVPAGTQIRLTPGESIYIQQYLYHDFEVEPGTGDVLLGEVSQCNDDAKDNRFNPPMGRFPAIEEDEAPYRLLCTEYPAAKD